MEPLKMIARPLLLAAALGSVAAAAAEQQAACTETHSKAFCVAAAARLAAGLKDSKPGEVREYVDRRASDSLWYAGAAAGLGTKTFARAPGLPAGVELGVMLLGMVASATAKEPDVFGRNMIVAWMPKELAPSRGEAEEAAQEILVAAMKQTFDGSDFTAETVAAPREKAAYSLHRREQIRYRLTGGRCEGHDCILTPFVMDNPAYGIIGTRARTTTTPAFIGQGESYVFSERPGALWAWSLVVDGKPATHTYLPELSKHLPAWMFVVMSPERKFPDGVLNEGYKVPVIYSQGRPLYFVFPEQDAKVSAN